MNSQSGRITALIRGMKAQSGSGALTSTIAIARGLSHHPWGSRISWAVDGPGAQLYDPHTFVVPAFNPSDQPLPGRGYSFAPPPPWRLEIPGESHPSWANSVDGGGLVSATPPSVYQNFLAGR